MTFNSNLQTTEPAFLSHEKYVRQGPSTGCQKRLTDCCYSLSNLALIVACVLALIFTVKFLNDDPLYEYGEYLLGLKFYRYIIYIIVILPLVLLVPLANAAGAFFLSGSRKKELGSSVVGVKIFYQVVMAILIFVGLVFIAPSIRHSNVANQMDIEFKRHMKWRYDSEFSYEFLDRIQAEYECCDELWYRSNYWDKLPLSCYHQDGTYSRIHLKSCADKLGAMVSNRCTIIALNLVVILLALAVLIGIDMVELMSAASSSSRHYDIRERSVNPMKQQDELETTSLSSRRNSCDDLDRGEDHDELVEELTNRLKMRERERDTPLLPNSQTATTSQTHADRRLSSDDDDDDELRPKVGDAILTRANYRHYNNRPKSPIFVRTPDSTGSLVNEPAGQTDAAQSNGNNQTGGSGGASPKSVLKKTSSFQRIDSEDSEYESEPREQLSRKAVQQQQRDAQTRRSLLNVRFAD